MDQSVGALFSGKICMGAMALKARQSLPPDWYWPWMALRSRGTDGLVRGTDPPPPVRERTAL